MPNPRFFKNAGPFTIRALADFVDAQLLRCADATALVQDVTPLETADAQAVTFYHNTRYQKALQSTQAVACLIAPEYISHAPEHLTLLVTPTPYRAYAQVCQRFYPAVSSEKDYICSTAMIASSAKIGKDCFIGPYVQIQENAVVGDDTTIEAFSLVGAGVQIGAHGHIASHVTITHSMIGDHAYIKTGARLGQKGFGFDMDARGPLSVPQLGCLRIGDNVEIGANTTIDRGSNHDTIIGDGVRIDNLVQIGHNVIIGDHSILVAQVGIAGSTELGKYVIIAGQAGLAGHLKVGDHTRIAAQSGVMKDVTSGESIGGTPAVPVRDFLKQATYLKRLIKDKGKNK